MRFEFTVPGQPLSVNRVYSNQRQGAAGRGRFTTREGKAFKALVHDLARIARGHRSPLDEPVVVALAFYFRTLASDIDGPVKPVLDALQRAGLFVNDNRIVQLSVTKAKDPENPRTEVRVEAVKTVGGC